MANGAFKFKDNSGNVVSFISGSGSNISFSGGTLDLSGMTGLTLGNLTLSGTTQNALSASHAASYLLTSSFNTYSGSFAITGSNLFKGDQTISGSVIPSVTNIYDLGSPTNNFRHLYLSSASLYIDGTKVLGSTSQELQITTDVGQSFKILEAGSDNITLQSADGNIEFKTSGGGDVVIDPTNGIIGLKGTVTVYTGNKVVSSDGNSIQFGNGITVTGSILSTVTPLVSGSSQIIYSGLTGIPSGIISSSAQVTEYGFATTGSNNFQGTQTITGSLYISQNLVVQGSSSLEDITGSNVYIGTNKINLNTDSPAIRFGGISVFDSGSNFGESGSLLWDSQNNRWLYQHPFASVAPYKSAILISGPQNSGSLGSETTLTTGKIQKAVGDDHIGDSIITETGDGIGISGSLSITGSIVATGTSLWSGSAQLPSGIISGSNQVISSLPSGTVSGSVQVDVMSTTNIARLATTGSNTFSGDINVITAGSSQFLLDGTNPTITLRRNNNGNASSAINFKGSTAIKWQIGTNQATGLGFEINEGDATSNKFYIAPGGNATITGQLGVNTVPEFPLDVKTTNASATAMVGSFHNLDYTTGTKTFVRVRTQTSAESSYSSYFGVGQDGTLNIIANDFARGGDIRINPNTGDVTTYRDLALRTSSLSNSAGTTNLTMYGSEGTSNKISMVQLWNSNQYPVNLISMTSATGGSASNGFLLQTSYWNGSSVSTANRFYVDGYTGRVSIGTTSANGIFDIRGSHVSGYGLINLVSTDPCLLSLDSTSTYDVRLRYKYNGTDKWFTGMYDTDSYDIRTGSDVLKIQVTQSGAINIGASMVPLSNGTLNLGSSSLRWNTVYTSDLSLSNGIGDYTIVEGENDLFLYNNKQNKVYKFLLSEVNPSEATPKKS